MKPYKLYIPAQALGGMEALGQLGGAAHLEDDIRMCQEQTIEPYFRKHLPKNEKVLEAGSGRGRWVFYLRRLGYDIVGIDIAQSDIQFAKSFDSSVPIEYENVLQTSFVDGSFGAVISLGVVEHFEEGPQKAFAEVRRLLKPGGLFLVTVPTQNVFRLLLIHRLKDVLLFIRKVKGTALGFAEYRYSRGEFTRLLRNSGFEILETAADDFLPPKNMGLFTDSRLFQHPSQRWTLNTMGNFLNRLFLSVSPWLHCSGTLWVCRKPR